MGEPARQNRVIDALAAAITEGKLSMEHVKSAHERLDRLFAEFVRPLPATAAPSQA